MLNPSQKLHYIKKKNLKLICFQYKFMKPARFQNFQFCLLKSLVFSVLRKIYFITNLSAKFIILLKRISFLYPTKTRDKDFNSYLLSYSLLKVSLKYLLCFSYDWQIGIQTSDKHLVIYKQKQKSRQTPKIFDYQQIQNTKIKISMLLLAIRLQF